MRVNFSSIVSVCSFSRSLLLLAVCHKTNKNNFLCNSLLFLLILRLLLRMSQSLFCVFLSMLLFVYFLRRHSLVFMVCARSPFISSFFLNTQPLLLLAFVLDSVCLCVYLFSISCFSQGIFFSFSLSHGGSSVTYKWVIKNDCRRKIAQEIVYT